MEFSVDRCEQDGHPIVRVLGELDFETAARMSAALDGELAAAPSTVGLDLTHTVFLDSAGARSIAQSLVTARACGTDMFLLCPASNTRIRRVLDLLQFESVVRIVERIPPRRDPSS